MKIDIIFKDATPEAIIDWVSQNFKKVANASMSSSGDTEVLKPINHGSILSPDADKKINNYTQNPTLEVGETVIIGHNPSPVIIQGSVTTDEATPDYDAHGLPWDARIHSSSKKLTAKGIWARRKGVDDITFEQVQNELRGATSTAPAASTPQLFPQPTAPIEQPQIPNWLQQAVADSNQQAANSQLSPAGFPPFNLTPAAPVASAPAPQPTIAPQTATGNYTFAGLMQTISSLMAQGQIDATYIQALALQVGQLNGKTVHAIVDIGADPKMIEQAFGILCADGKVQ